MRFFVILTLAVSLIGCRSVAQPSQPQAITLRIVQQPNLSNAPYFVAIEEGYFAEQGITLELVRFARSQDAIPALVQGDLDVLGGAMSFGFLNAIGRGGKIKIVADRGYNPAGSCANNAIMVRKSLYDSGQLRESAQFKGRKVSVNLAANQGLILLKAIQPGGLTLDDIVAEEVQDQALEQALKQGAIDATIAAEPLVTRLVRSGEAVVWRSTSEIAPDAQFGYVAYGPTLLEKNPDAGRRFMIAYLKGVQKYREGKTERNLEILAKHTELDKDLLKEACWTAMRDNGQIDTKSIMEFQAWGLQRKLLDTLVTPEKFWDGRFVEQALAVLKPR